MASRVMKIRKRSGGLRTIELPPEHVKVAQRQLLRLLTHNSREDLSVPQALYRFVENINTGFHWVASMDIKDCFTSINPKKTLARIDTRITEGVPGQYGRRSLPQGHPISPFLANTYLRQFDQMAASWKIPYYLSNGSTIECKVIRYVDNIWLMCRKKNELESYLSLSLDYLSDLGVTPGVESIQIRHVNQGIDLLGYTAHRWSIRPNPKNIQRFKHRCMKYALRRKELEKKVSSTEDTTESIKEVKANITCLDQRFDEFLTGGKNYYGPTWSWMQRLFLGLNLNPSVTVRKRVVRKVSTRSTEQLRRLQRWLATSDEGWINGAGMVNHGAFTLSSSSVRDLRTCFFHIDTKTDIGVL
jgi:hypothetical protein